jgi:hypothetical protein
MISISARPSLIPRSSGTNEQAGHIGALCKGRHDLGKDFGGKMSSVHLSWAARGRL